MNTQGYPYSELWGRNGETWTPESRLPDFSFAGYRFGEVPLPQVPVTANVRNFGARGDGETDDTDAFKRAIDATDSGAILIPQGRYLIRDILWIEKPNIVLRGEGPYKSLLHFTTELEDVRPDMAATTLGQPTSRYSWSGGFVWLKGDFTSEAITDIVSEHPRGARSFTVSDATNLKVGQRVGLVMHDLADPHQRTLLSHLYSDDPGNVSKMPDPVRLSMVSRVASVDGNRVTLERPARLDLRKEWSPRLETFTPSVSEVGIEELAFSFPPKRYPGHFTERGMNPIAMSAVSDCWVRNIRISNCDSGIHADVPESMFITLDGIRFDCDHAIRSGGDLAEVTGHHGLTPGVDCLIQNFLFETHFFHDLTVKALQSGNVFKNGSGPDMNFDHHKRAPYENLFCNIDAGEGSRLWQSSGGADLGKHSGARGTFWNIRTKAPVPYPPSHFGPDSITMVGIKTRDRAITDPHGKWFEAIPPAELYPQDLHAAQLARRLGEGE